jgi:hypothetical protein
MMRGIRITALATGVALSGLFGPASVASAHLHPFVPAAQCAPERTGAGNEAEGIRQAPWVPAEGQFIVTTGNPGKVEDSAGAAATPLAGNPGVQTATAQCATPQTP